MPTGHAQWMQFIHKIYLSSFIVALQNLRRGPTTISQVERFSWEWVGGQDRGKRINMIKKIMIHMYENVIMNFFYMIVYNK